MLRTSLLSVLVVAVAVATSATTRAVAHDDPCHVARTCPSDDHSYAWNGMSCTSSDAKRLPEDQIPVEWLGVHYWCHVVTDGGMGGGKPGVTSPSCKADRAAVGTMRDAAASKVRLAAATATVRRLARLRFDGSSSDQRSDGVERTVYRLEARLLRARLSNRSEWELTIGDLATGATLVAGFPAHDCTAGADPDLRAKIAAARGALVRACGLRNVGGTVRLRGRVTLEAVGFVPSRGTAGAARVQLELRPVLTFAATSCVTRR